MQRQGGFINRTANITLIMSLLFIASSADAALYRWDFRKGHFDNLSLVPSGPGAINLLQPTPQGLRVLVPTGFDVKNVGFTPRFKISGDFDIEIHYTIVNRTLPKSGFGTGPNIYLSMGSTKDPAASLGRVLRPDGRDVYGVFAARLQDGKRIPTAKLIPVSKPVTSPSNRSNSGTLQLKRKKGDITYAIQDDSNPQPRELATLPVTDADVTMIRIGLSQSDVQSAGEIYVHDVRIDADDLPQLPSEQSREAQFYRPRYQPPPAPRSYRWLWQSLTAAVLAGSTVVWLWRRNRR